MCDTRGHEHWCGGCGKNLNKEPKDSYIEIEWSQNDKGRIIAEKNMICKSCLDESENIKELDKFFKDLEYSPWGHVFCSSCKKDLTTEIGKNIEPGKDYECLNFKCHERSGPNIKHIIKVVVLCQDCVKKEFNADNLEKLKKLGKNPLFKPTVTCPNTDTCSQFKEGDENVNCKHIVIGRDRETLNFGLLCGRRHKGCQLLPFDDGFAISRPRKGKGAAVASPTTIAIAPGINPVQDAMKEIEKMLKKFKLGKFSDPLPDYTGKFLNIEARLLNVEKALNIQTGSITPISNICNIQENTVKDIGQNTDTETNIPVVAVAHVSVESTKRKTKKKKG